MIVVIRPVGKKADAAVRFYADAVGCNLVVAGEDDERNSLFVGLCQRFDGVSGPLRPCWHGL